jgi:hypothetical protein
MNFKIDEIKQELEPLFSYIQIITDENDNILYNGIGLKKGITFKDLKNFNAIPKNTTQKEFIKLIDFFNDNRTEFYFAYKELSE